VLDDPVREGRPNPSGLPSLSRPPVRPFIVAPEACRLQRDDRTHLTLTQINLAYRPRAGPASRRQHT
jgi:hypothetical protein